MEIHSDNQVIYIILFDSNESFLELKKKECLDQLSSLFSDASILSKLELQKFLLNGLGIYQGHNLNDTAYWENDMTVVQKTKDIMRFEIPFGADYGYSITFKRGIGITNKIQNGFIYIS